MGTESEGRMIFFILLTIAITGFAALLLRDWPWR